MKIMILNRAQLTLKTLIYPYASKKYTLLQFEINQRII